MTEYYRKLFEPEYGEAAPDAIIDTNTILDLNHPTESRIAQNFETIMTLTQHWRKVFCYPRLMEVPITNLTIPSDGTLLPIRIYHPMQSGPYKVLLFFHGGGWMCNNLDVYDQVCRYFACFGNVLVIAPDYRLCPEHPFPAGFNDCYNATVWAASHCTEYGGKPESINVCGDSAGGNLATVVCLRARDEQGPSIAKQFLFFPVTTYSQGYRTYSELRYGGGDYFLVMDSNSGFDPPYLKDLNQALSPYVSPLYAEDLSKLPPACFLSAECDPLLDQALMYAAKLQDHGTPVEYHLYTGMVHAFLNRPQQKSFEAMDCVIAAMP